MNLLDAIKIYDTEYTKIRLGNSKDGGYVVLKELSKKTNVLYSYGIDNDISFELNYAKVCPELKARLFDHTIIEPPKLPKNFTFLKEGISSYKENNLDTLQNHLEKYNDINVSNKTLKLDIEWNEWSVFENIPIDILDGFDQILCEFHNVFVTYNDTHTPYFTQFYKNIYQNINNSLNEKYEKVLEKICNKFIIFHAHINNSLDLVELNGIQIPPLLEVSFVNKKHVKSLELSNAIFPIEGLDYPNKPYKKDILNFPWNKK